MKILSANNSNFLKSSKTKLNTPGFLYNKNPCGEIRFYFYYFLVYLII